ncbi:MAG TPA: cysteine--tRNA ligase [Baekduia sp.]|uniref:cysteine--tRNA ligase n=1 Tax=Baekduia sp. TaxID=2600305 RepID=UPI002D7665B2|nr:cysteine--tRNA ligase [Baekduia sp.]HET6506853.1 cysteine--tRNA ligase [Baekduia sp.]
MPDIRIHDTRSGQQRPLVAREPGAKVGIYACGPTVYNRIHIGNARPFVVFSWLKRFLVHEGYDATFVANVTDVNDKIYDAARARGIPSEDLAREMTAHYVADTDALGLGRPDHEPLASETIDGIVALIEALLDREAAYAVDGDVYFRVRKDAEYGSLSHRHLDDLDQGEGDPDPTRPALKEDPLDFALWKAQKEGEDTAWDAPWGRGRPGWHIECSAMAEELLGVGFEIHGGGSDLVFPHHENEAAQTRLGRGAELAQIWMHNGMLEMRGEKMSKSVGNISLLPDVIDEWGAETILMFFARGHYRQPLVFAPDTLRDAQGFVRRVREAGRRLVDGPSPDDMAPIRDEFFEALRDDFNTPRAVAALAAWVSEANRREGAGRDQLVEMLDIFGLAALARGGEDDGDGPDDAAVALLAARNAAREAKDWAEADRLRDALSAAGWVVRDGPDGAELVRP